MAEEETTNTENKQQFQIQKLYLKDASFESPNSPSSFTQEWKPQINFELNTETNDLGNGHFDVALSATVTAKLEDKTAFLVEIKQAGIFQIGGFNPEDLSAMLGSFCPNILFPYAREAVSDLVVKGGFPPLLLAPVNFDALYAQQLEQQDQPAS